MTREELNEHIGRPGWHDDGACRGYPLMWWFHKAGPGLVAAKRICAACPVRGECLAWALEHHEVEHGVFAGTTATQRVAMRRDAARPAAAA